MSLSKNAPNPAFGWARKSGLLYEVPRLDELTRRIVIGPRLGQGAYSTVFEGAYQTPDGQSLPLAIKRLKRGDVRDTEVSSMLREEGLLRRVRSRHVMESYAVVHVLDEGAYYTLVELVQGMDLDRYASLAAQRSRPLSPQAFWSLARGLGLGLAALHHAGVVHRDIKPANVMLRGTFAGPDAQLTKSVKGPTLDWDAPLDPVIVDLGFSCLDTRKMTVDDLALACAPRSMGTPRYMAPGVFQLKARQPPPRDELLKVLRQADLHALGVTLYEILEGGRHPFLGDGEDPFDRARLARGGYPYLPRQVSDGFLGDAQLRGMLGLPGATPFGAEDLARLAGERLAALG